MSCIGGVQRSAKAVSVFWEPGLLGDGTLHFPSASYPTDRGCRGTVDGGVDDIDLAQEGIESSRVWGAVSFGCFLDYMGRHLGFPLCDTFYDGLGSPVSKDLRGR